MTNLRTTHIASVACSEYIFRKTTRAGESYITRQNNNKQVTYKDKYFTNKKLLTLKDSIDCVTFSSELNVYSLISCKFVSVSSSFNFVAI